MTFPVPSLDKTWQFQVNVAFPALGAALTDNRTMWLAIKNALKGTGSWADASNVGTSRTNAFTVRYSCGNGVAGSAGDGVDRWAVITDLIWAAAGSGHSWIVLRQAAIATNYEICISCEAASAQGAVITVVVSPSAGFTGGTTTARPTATDEIAIANGAASLSSADVSYRLHVLGSSDGQCTRVFVYSANVVQVTLCFEKPKNPVSGWTNPSASLVLGNAAAPVMANVYASAAWNGKGVSAMTMFGSCESAASANLPADMVAPNDLSTFYPFLTMGLYSKTASNRGRHGQLFDLWYGLVVAGDGDAYPDATRAFGQVGDWIIPWNSTTLLTA